MTHAYLVLELVLDRDRHGGVRWRVASAGIYGERSPTTVHLHNVQVVAMESAAGSFGHASDLIRGSVAAQASYNTAWKEIARLLRRQDKH